MVPSPLRPAAAEDRGPEEQEQTVSPPHRESLCPALWTPAKGHIYKAVRDEKSSAISSKGESRACLALVCVTANVPAQGDGHVAPPDGVSAQDNGPGDGTSCIQADWLVQHEQSLLPVCRPEEKDHMSVQLMQFMLINDGFSSKRH